LLWHRGARHARRAEKQGFEITAQSVGAPDGSYQASVTLTPSDPLHVECKFSMPLCKGISTEDEVLHEAIHYGRDLVDGLLPWFDPRQTAC
jgi:hypothetical protein